MIVRIRSNLITSQLKITIAASASFFILIVVLSTAVKATVSEDIGIPAHSWSHTGPFGRFNKAALRRGFHVFRNVCSTCHGIQRVAYRNLTYLGYSEDEIKSIASEVKVLYNKDGGAGLYERPGLPSDKFTSPFPNEQAARDANGGSLPPDLSLITKARPNGLDYVRAILLGYEPTPSKFHLMSGLNYNAYFPGHQIAMPQPLYGDDVTFEDGTATSLEQEAEDVVTFLAWTAMPEMEERKRMGIITMIFLVIFTLLMYACKRAIWKDLE
ncbi:cytochrome c1 [Candidatus Endolissoclinum faulkneri L2]|uniref:Cytochrome c1 n=1 Tax=Candidatus Endolissoclinum faulkneri L2 TaxID=1193729 RepID=K7YH18_9PROT|nr:cytochrome c1 [Candidatus Endolissoclinum faulkneri]AFX98850.1 cytochrome c1 [Candidatus Endolissoclinum faulkneri L2]